MRQSQIVYRLRYNDGKELVDLDDDRPVYETLVGVGEALSNVDDQDIYLGGYIMLSQWVKVPAEDATSAVVPQLWSLWSPEEREGWTFDSASEVLNYIAQCPGESFEIDYYMEVSSLHCGKPEQLLKWVLENTATKTKGKKK